MALQRTKVSALRSPRIGIEYQKHGAPLTGIGLKGMVKLLEAQT